MDQKELNERLELHEKWLLGQPDGKRLKLLGEHLSGLDLSAADIRFGDLRGCDLHDCNLRHLLAEGSKGLKVVEVLCPALTYKICYYPELDVVTEWDWQSSMAVFKKHIEASFGDGINPSLYARYQRVIAFLEQEAAADKEKDDCATSRQGAENGTLLAPSV